MAEEITNTQAPETAAEEKPEQAKKTVAAKTEAVEVKAEEAKAAPKKAAAKKAPAKKAVAKAAEEKTPAKKVAAKAAAKKAPAKKAAAKTTAKKAPAKKAAPKAPEKATPAVYVIRTAQKVTDSLPAPVSGYNEKIMTAVTTGVDFVEEMTKTALATAAVYVDLGKQKVNERTAGIQGKVKMVADTATITALQCNEKYVKKALESGKKTLETGTDLVEDMGMVALETFGTMAENGKKIAARLPMADKVKALTSKMTALASR
ncbi:MAG: hypothetical protein JEZ02_13525 [Desulfatibacillum sp.]|nr:hypothetical protein [Desulfatibacillum sp.]